MPGGGAAPPPGGASTPPPDTGTPPPQRGLRNLTGLLLVAAAHPRQAIATSVGVGVVAALAGRPTREVGLVMLTVLVGQVILGWHNDLVDRQRDARHGVPRKPIADGRLDPGTAWFAVACGVLLVVPLSVANGVTAGSAYLLALAVGLLGNVVLRKGVLSWLPWAAQFALYPAFVSYGGWGGDAMGNPPVIAMTVLAALLGVGVHFLRALWGLVPDNADGWTYLPLRAGLKLGASRLLLVVSVYCLLVVVALCVTGTYVGLEQ